MEIKTTYDAIIIGSGPGGLSSGILLSKTGKKVLMIEKNAEPGGSAAWFERNGIHFEAGAHFLSGLGEDGNLTKILRDMEIENEVEFSSVGPPYQFIGKDGINFTIWNNREKFTRNLKEQFPAEKENIDKYIILTEKIGAEFQKMRAMGIFSMPLWKRLFYMLIFPLLFPNMAKYRRRTIEEAHAEIFNDKRLALMLCIYVYPGMSFANYASFMLKQWKGDVSQPKGGLKPLVMAMINRFQKNGGELLLRSKVEKVLVENGKAVGVKLANGKEFRSTYVVSDADARKTFANLVGEEHVKKSFINKLNRQKVSESLFMTYIATDIDITKFKFDSCQVTYLPTYEIATADDLVDKPELVKNSWICFVFDSIIQPSLSPPGVHILKIGRWMPYNYRNFWQVDQNGNRGENYQKLKEEVADVLIKYAEDLIPDLSKHIIVKVSATPLTFARYIGTSEGATAGWNWDAHVQFKIAQKTPIKNLYQVGHFTWQPGGFLGSMVTGKMATKLIEKEERKTVRMAGNTISS